LDDEVIFNQIFSLSRILDEDSVAHGVIGNIVLNSQVVNSMNSDGSVVSVVNGVIPDVRVVNCSNHVEMDRVSSQLEGLSNLLELSILNSTS
jgi:hypothetical protein